MTGITQSGYEPRFGRFHDLMKFRVREILLVSSFYDAFVLEEDGGLSERIFSEYTYLNLTFTPRIIRVSSAEEAFKALRQGNFDMVITMARLSGMNVLEFGQKIKEMKPGMPVILLTYEWVEVDMLIRMRETRGIDKVFYWTGDTRILLAIIKYIEDMKNVDNDMRQGVRVILIIEDSPKFHSMFLPMLYTQIMTQTRLLISEGVNDLHRVLRMRARPKIVMAETYEDGKKLYKKYKKRLLGVISDIRFPRKGDIDPQAGFRFAAKVKKEIPDLPFLLISSNTINQEQAHKKGLDFLHKNSENLLHELNRFILSDFGFGDFVFKDGRGRELCRARNIREFVEMLSIVPEDSILYHAGRNHISIWMRARTEFEIAEQLRPKKISDFENVEQIRQYIINEIRNLRAHSQMGVIMDFRKSRVDYANPFIRLGVGSMGGKARGIAFLNVLMAHTKMADRFDNVRIKIPQTFVICSDIFEQFVHENNLLEFAITKTDNNVIARKFMRAKLPAKISKDLKALMKELKYPLAVRSSSLLEDSQMLPFAGLYSTYMLPNNQPDFKTRFKELSNAVKLVFASVFFKSPRQYVKNTNFRIEEEKMAVIIQQVVGRGYGDRFYPVISGVAQSYNFYPISHMGPQDGVVQLALGLGMTVVEGGTTHRFSPRYPEMNPPYSSAQEFMRKSQNHFYSIDMAAGGPTISNDEKYSLKRCDLGDAEQDGALFFVGSTYELQDNAIRDTLSIKGPRVVTFANILKYKLFPLAEVLKDILATCRQAFGSHIEMEFAVNLFKDKTRKPEFYLLQVRPMVAGQEDIEINLDNISPADMLCSSTHAMGNGAFKNLSDIILVDPDRFDAAKSRLIAEEVGQLNEKLRRQKKNYILIGYGRWGTSDPWLGIPVEWHQISNARVVIEANLDHFKVDPSQGSHFFHNLTSLGMGYFHIGKRSEWECLDLDLLQNTTPVEQTHYVKHLSFPEPLDVRLNARLSRGVILKPPPQNSKNPK